MSKTTVLGAALVLLLLVFPLVQIGTVGRAPPVWWVGLAALVVGGLIPPVSRFVTAGGDEDDESSGDGKEGGSRESSGGQDEDGTADGRRPRQVAPVRATSPAGVPFGTDSEPPGRVQLQVDKSEQVLNEPAEDDRKDRERKDTGRKEER